MIPRCVLALALAAVPAAAQEFAPAAAPSQPPVTLDLTEIWRVGGADSDLMFGTMIEALADGDGNVYLLDQQLARVTVVAPGGEVTGFLGAEGDGPGEIRLPQDMMFMPDGSLALAQQFPGKLVCLDLDGTPGPTITLGSTGQAEGGFTAVSNCASRGGTLLIGALLQAPIEHGQSRQSYLATVAADGSELVRFCQHDTELDFQRAHFVEGEMVAPFFLAHAIGKEGRIYAAPDRNAYRIDVYAADGSRVGTMGRTFEPLRRSRRELDRMNELFAAQDRQLPFDITWEVETNEPTLTGLRVDADGLVWVEHARSAHEQPAGVFKTYDVFTPAGEWLRRVAVRCAGDPQHDDLVFLGDGRVLMVRGLVLARMTASGSGPTNFEEGDIPEAQEVICLRVVGS